MSEPIFKSDQQLQHEEILRQMAAENGGELVTDANGRMRLQHPPTPPAPSR